MAMHVWPTRVGSVLQMLDPTVGPRLILDRLWIEVSQWGGKIAGIWLHCRPGHLSPSGTYLVGEPPANADELSVLATPATAPIATDGLPVVARQLRDGNVPVATLLISHRDTEDAAAFLIDACSRWLVDRLRLQLQASELNDENQALRDSLALHVRQHDVLTNSGTMQALIRSAARAAASHATVLIQGETGTGKELIARLIHAHSPRAHRSLVSVNAGALAPGLIDSELFGHVRGAFTGAERERKGVFEVASGGTLFLDEVGELPLETQVRLLRVLQERTITRVGDHHPIPIDVRIVAATHRDLTSEVRAGRFREDLLYRLNVVHLVVPPLRERREDIPLLVNHFLQKYNRENFKNVDDVPRSVIDLLLAYPWPGNVRELENCVHKAVVLAPGNSFIDELIPPTIRAYGDSLGPEERHRLRSGPQRPPEDVFREALEAYASTANADLNLLAVLCERILIRWCLNSERGVKLRAAKRLGINRVTLDRKLVEYDIGVQRGHGALPPAS